MHLAQGRLLSMPRAVCSAKELRHACPLQSRGQPSAREWTGSRQAAGTFSFLSYLPAPSLAGSLTSLIYGEQSEKTSPSETSLEMERRDKVSAGSGLGVGSPRTGQAGVVCTGRSTAQTLRLCNQPGSTTSKFLSLPHTQFPHQKDGDIDHTYY